jgi:hypothetical protein
VAFDVGARLAEGRPAIADFENYVRAAHALGYQNPDLTAHSAQIRDLYGSEDGLDLRALEADADALSRLASRAGDALRAEADGVAALAGAWKGQAADSAREFLRRQQDSAAAVSAAVHEAAVALSTLRDQLWHAVDAKVDTVQAIDGRCGPQRAEWLAAAHVVLSGGGDRAAASETVDQKVRPFVEGDIGSDWVAAMHASTASVAAAYDAAIAAVRPDRFIAFEVPGYVGPTWQAPLDVSPSTNSPGGAPTPALEPAVAQTVPAAVPNPSPALAPDVPTPPASAVSATPEPPPSSPGLGDLGGAMPAMGAGLSGLGRQLSDGIACLTGLTGAGREALSKDDEPDPSDQQDEREDDEDDREDDWTGGSNDSDHATVDGAVGPSDGEPPADSEGRDGDLSKSTTDHPPPPATPPPPPPPPPPVPTPSPEPLATDLTPRPQPPARTPCEIAAGEVPQVGE